MIPRRLLSTGSLWLLACQPHDVPVLVSARLLKPLGNPPSNSVKFFATLELLEQVKDRTWLAKVTNALLQHWRKKNAAKRDGAVLPVQPLLGAIRGSSAS